MITSIHGWRRQRPAGHDALRRGRSRLRVSLRASLRTSLVGVVLVGLFAASSVKAEPEAGGGYSPNADDPHANQVFWGDTHLHTSWSPDAGGPAIARSGPTRRIASRGARR